MKQLYRCSLVVLTGALAACSTGPKPAVAVFDRANDSAYYYPLISPGTQFAALPPAVQHTIRAETGGTDIETILKDTFSGQPVYRVYFVNQEAFPPLYVAPDGSVLNSDLSIARGAAEDRFGILAGGGTASLTLGDLPQKVVKEIQRQAPDAEINSISKETQGDQTLYVISFKGERHPELTISSDGVVLEKPKVHIRTPK